jgi:hypothetical protein
MGDKPGRNGASSAMAGANSVAVPILLQHQNLTRSRRLGHPPPAPREFSGLGAEPPAMLEASVEANRSTRRPMKVGNVGNQRPPPIKLCRQHAESGRSILRRVVLLAHPVQRRFCSKSGKRPHLQPSGPLRRTPRASASESSPRCAPLVLSSECSFASPPSWLGSKLVVRRHLCQEAREGRSDVAATENVSVASVWRSLYAKMTSPGRRRPALYNPQRRT